MKLTVNINPKDVIAITHADDGRAVLSFGLVTDGGCNVEIALTVEEKADDGRRSKKDHQRRPARRRDPNADGACSGRKSPG